MGNEHVALREIHVLGLQQPPHRRVIVPDALVLQRLGRQSREHIGHQPEMHRSPRVLQGHAGELPSLGQRARDVNALLPQQSLQKAQTLAGIVIARREQHRDPLLRKAREQLRQQLHRVPGRGAPVVDVPGDQHRVWPKLPAQFQKAPDPVCLVPAFQQGYAVKALSQVQVRQMQKSHTRSPQSFLFLQYTTPWRDKSNE